MQLARSVGATGILVRTGKEDGSPHAGYTVEDLGEAVDLILRTDRAGQC
jgi:hypothetical protein